METQDPALFESAESAYARPRAIGWHWLADTGPEVEFDEIVRLAGELCATPMSLVTLLDAEQQLHKVHGDTAVHKLPFLDGFCRHTVQSNDLFVVPDSAIDARFQHTPTAIGDSPVRFYAGVPLLADIDLPVGALCVIDIVPRTLTDVQSRALRVLGRQISAQLQLRARATAMEELALELRSERELFHGFLDSMPLEAYLKDTDGNLLFYNRRITDRFGLQSGEWLGQPGTQLWSSEEPAQARSEERNILQSGRAHESYATRDLPGGERSHWKVVRTPLQRPTGETFLANVAIDLTDELRREKDLRRAQDELQEANRKLRSLALTDDLTHLWNRRALDSRLEIEVSRAHADSLSLALLMIDVDDFKRLNDDHGHSHGDQALVQIAAVLRRVTRESDMAARFGGEEFAVILPNSQIDGARALCTRLNDDLKTAPWSHRALTVSIGIAMCRPGNTADDLLSMADHAMYRAKRSGKNCVVAYEAESTESTAS